MARSKTPNSIEVRNFHKRHGSFQVWITEDLQFIAFQSNRRTTPFSTLVIDHLKKLGAEVQTNGKGISIAWLSVKQKPEVITKLLKLAAVPEACQRCGGSGEIPNPVPCPKDPPRGLMETSREYHDRIYAERTAAGIPTSWGAIVKCPACLGSGRVAQLEAENA